jgi:hypothetical protein
MPLYQTSVSGAVIGTYNAQRPSKAACKAFTQLRTKNKDIETVQIEVCTTCKKKSCIFNVKYQTQEQPDAFGITSRPVAEKVAANEL